MSQNNTEHWIHNRENSPYQVSKTCVKLYKKKNLSSLRSYPRYQTQVRNQILASLAGKALTVHIRQEAGLSPRAICPN
jgi:hypothetical protein